MSELLYKRDKSAADINDLIIKHKNIVYYMLGLMGQTNNSDAESAAYEALWDAVSMFDVYGTTSFSNYACHLIRNAVNGVLRKQQAEHEHICIVSEIPEDAALTTYPETDNVELIAEIYKHFDSYINKRQGLCRNILLVWYSSNFEISNTQVAQVCGCSVSYVSRVQQDFRAYLSGKLAI